MEPHKTQLSGISDFRPDVSAGPVEYFKKAWEFTNAFYSEEVKRIGNVKLDDVTERFFFWEYVWVVHATGFSAKAVGKFLPKLMEAYGEWSTLGIEDFDDAFKRIQPICNNPQKSKAVWKTAKKMCDEVLSGQVSWDDWKKTNLSTPELITKLPYVGKITCYHLGRNIGLLECVKPDLHLVRMADHWGFKDCDSMCDAMRKGAGVDAPLGLVDLALWYSASTFGTLGIRKEGSR